MTGSILFICIFMIPVVAIIGGLVYQTIHMKERYRLLRERPGSADDDTKRWMADNAANQQQLLAKLDALDQRLAGVEKTLNEIPS
ncbi:MAG: hypothetical protein WA777_05225 [Rhodanobacter sp.]